MSRLVLTSIAGFLSLFLIISCGKKVSRVASDSTIDLSGKWNDTDSRLVAEEMIKDALSRQWLHKYKESKTNPKIIVGKISNKSHEHISVETFVKDIERALLNSGQVDFVASKSERSQLREEVSDMQSNASATTSKSAGEELAADLMLLGSINTIVDQEGKKAVIFYQVDMELIELETNSKKWIGDKKIKKYVTRSNTKF